MGELQLSFVLFTLVFQKEKVMKKFGLSVLYVFSIVLAVGVGVMQAGKSGSLDNRAQGSGGPGCSYKGYWSMSCAGTVPGCVSGTYMGTLNGTADMDNFKGTGTASVRGYCSGSASCITPLSLDLTSDSCGG